MNLVFFGTGTFAIPALKSLAAHISMVVTQPPRESGRGRMLRPSPVHLAANELGIRVETPEKARHPGFVERVVAAEPDALVVASYGQILSQAMLDSAVRGGINLHASILPAYRGAAPIQRALLAGEEETGVTLMQMDKGMDTGNIIEIVRTRIEEQEIYGELQVRLAEIAGGLAEAWLPRIVEGDYPSTPQDDRRASLAPKVERMEGRIDLSESAVAAFNRYRAFTPKPGAFIETPLGTLKLHRAALKPEAGEPGQILSLGRGMALAFAGGSLDLLEVQPEGKTRMSGRDYANGHHLRVGMSLLPTA